MSVGLTRGVWWQHNGSWFEQAEFPPGRERLGSFADAALAVRDELDSQLRAGHGGLASHLYLSLERERRSGLRIGPRAAALVEQVRSISTSSELYFTCGVLSASGIKGVVWLDPGDTPPRLVPGSPLFAGWSTPQHGRQGRSLLQQALEAASAMGVRLTVDPVTLAALDAGLHSSSSGQVKELLSATEMAVVRDWMVLRLLWNGLALTGFRRAGQDEPAEIDALELVQRLVPREVDHLVCDSLQVSAKAGRVATLAQDIRTALIEEIQEVTWLARDSRHVVLERIGRLRIEVGPQPSSADGTALPAARDAGVTPEDGLLDVLLAVQRDGSTRVGDGAGFSSADVNLSYSAQRNRVAVPAAVLRPPFFDESASHAHLYGSLGALLGHEMVHVLDPADQGGLVVAEWSEDERRRLRAARTRASVAIEGVGFPAGGDYPTQAQAVAVELFADVVGLRAAWRALRARCRLGGQRADRAAFLEAWARVWRVAYAEDFVARTHARTRHPHPVLRCNLAAAALDRPRPLA